ncbi:hypothetical protein [Marinicella meishanensis]|uniref:hypothetical protein n=1 Tax=Marinicella meishanensis TaxID=2873263 RepID=UPI001CBBED2B|nr:hypothetical protein [Marinicella sp. NBU2979]
MKQVLLTGIVLLMMVMGTRANTINPILIDQAGVHFQAVAVLDDRLLYEKTFEPTSGIDATTELWAFDPDTNQHRNLMTLSTRFGQRLRNYRVYQGAVYFNGDIDGSQGSGVWRTDLTAGGTVELPGAPGSIGLVISNDLLFTKQPVNSSDSHDYRLARVTSDGVAQFDLSVTAYLDGLHVCAFGPQHVVVLTTKPDDVTVISRYFNGEVVELTGLVPERFNLEVKSMFLVDHQCFIAVKQRNSSQLPEILRVNVDGGIQRYQDDPDIAAYRTQEFLTINGRVFGAGLAGFYRLDPTFQTIDLATELTDDYWGRSSFTGAQVFQDHIVVLETITADPPPRFLSFFDANLQRVESSVLIGNDRYFRPVQVYPTATNSLLKLDKDYQGLVQDLLVVPTAINAAGTLKYREIRIDQVVADPGSQVAYLNTTNNITQVKGIHAIEQQPTMGDQANGPWVDLSRERQGLVITKGQRADGSAYLFVTIYTFRNGQPLWLAGSANIENNQQTITMAISEYRGIDLFEQGNTPEQQAFGSLTMGFTGCDAMLAVIDYGDDTVALNLTRIDDVTFVDRCID